MNFLSELREGLLIAWDSLRANKLRSALTTLGIVIGIVTVTLMGTAINGIDKGFQNSLAMLGDDVLYVQKWPWGGVEDWWNYQNRPRITADMADKLNQIIEKTPNSTLEVAVPVDFMEAVRGASRSISVPAPFGGGCRRATHPTFAITRRWPA